MVRMGRPPVNRPACGLGAIPRVRLETPPPTAPAATRPTVRDRAYAAAARLKRSWYRRPRVGLILGSGLAGLADAIDVEFDVAFEDLPGLLAPTAKGHKGTVLCGLLADVPVVACGGRLHGYEGHPDGQLRFPIRLFDEMGVDAVVLSNAAGGVNPAFRAGDVMLMTDHVDLIGRQSLAELRSLRLPTPAADCYCPRLCGAAVEAAERIGRPLHRGTYAALTGPTYETRAEYRLFRTLKVDAVGMSTAPEADEAARRGLPVLAFSTITNECDPDCLGETSGDQVVDVASKAEPFLRAVVEAVFDREFGA